MIFIAKIHKYCKLRLSKHTQKFYLNMKNLFHYSLIAVLLSTVLFSCSKPTISNSGTSTLTGWKYNDAKHGGFSINNNYTEQKPPSGMVLIQGGSFTMGSIQDDIMSDWNTTPKKMQLRTFYMDEAEVTNSEYLFYLLWLERVFPPHKKNYGHIYESALPDTLVWRRALGSNESLTQTYLRHPAYANYPVVGVSWSQANDYCKWRTDRVNEKILMDIGVLKQLFDEDSITVEGRNHFSTETYYTNPKLLFDGDSTIYDKGLKTIKRRKDKDIAEEDYDDIDEPEEEEEEEIAEAEEVQVENDSLNPTPEVVAEASVEEEEEEEEFDDIAEDAPKREGHVFEGSHVKPHHGILYPDFRLPTEAEWEYAAKALHENREYNNQRGRKKYPWNGRYTRYKNTSKKGDQLANFKQGKGDYTGIAGWSNDGADITNQIKSYEPNAFGLYDMAGNVAEWVYDVYRPIIDNEMNDFNYMRGNVYMKKLIDEEGKVKVAEYEDIVYDTLVNGKIVPRDIPGRIMHVPITSEDTYMRFNYSKSNNININDGELLHSKYYNEELANLDVKPRMYNSPVNPPSEFNYDTGKFEKKYDKKPRTTLIGDNTRVYKGGSWRDREFWLDPAQRRYLPQYMSTDFIGFRCALDKVGNVSGGKKTAH